MQIKQKIYVLIKKVKVIHINFNSIQILFLIFQNPEKILAVYLDHFLLGLINTGHVIKG